MKIEEIEAKSMLVLSNLPDTDYVVNPYTGCQFACLYCYASFMGRFVNEPRSNWGNYVYVKSNAVDVIREELAKWSDKRCQSSVLLSSVTDPYQGLEKKYQLTRGILEAFLERKYPGLVSILTKSPLVLRDVDVIKQLPNAEVGMTITTTDDNLSHFLEVAAPLATQRLETLRKLNDSGLKTYAFVGPLLPHFRYESHLLDKLFSEIARSGVQQVYIEHINLPQYIKERLFPELKGKPEEIQKVYDGAIAKEHRNALDIQIQELLFKYGLHARLGGTIYHPELEDTKKRNAEDVVKLVEDAINEDSLVRISYRDFQGNETERIINPIRWENAERSKVLAHCQLRNDDRNFVIQRIVWAEKAG